MTTIKNRIQAIQQQIHDCENQTGRKPDSVTLLAVSKAQPSALIREAFAAGQRKFGENYVQEALKKQTELHDLPIEWHFIGPIQSNKTQLIAQNFAWAHSIERLKIAERLNDARPENLPPLQVCIQVNVSQEASKAGVSPEALADLAQAISLLPNIRLRGLMAIPEPTSDITKQHAQFKMLHDLLKTLTDQELALDTLSMGMSDDFPVAIAEGATTIRIGTAVFGQRKKPNNKIEKNYIMKTSFIGGGNMANALIGGLQKKGFAMADISVIEPDEAKRIQLQTTYGVKVSDQLTNAATADVIVLAVKPQQLRDIAIFLGSLLKNQLIISIAAGIRCADLARWLGGYNTIVRVMPNTPAQIQAGVSALFAMPRVTALQRDQATALLAAAGETLWLEDEEKMDAVTAISGSGPAYVFYFIEALQQAALDLGLSAEQARMLSLQTFKGASLLALQSEDNPAQLRQQVTSKGGTTEYALLSMDTAGVKNAIVSAALAAAARAHELGELLGKD